MRHALAEDDRRFRADFEARRVAPNEFDHRAHVRLAYTYLAEHDDEEALAAVRAVLRAFLAHHGVPPSKYHETMTRAWVLAVRHFMETTPACASAAAFLAANPALLDAQIMRSHYSAATLFSDEARARFVEPDLEAIPRYGGADRVVQS